VNNFLLRLKVVSLAAVALVLAMTWLPSFTAFAQPAHVVPAQSAASAPASSAFERRAARMPDNAGQERPLSPGPIIGLICAIVASSVALGVAFGIRRRIDQIAGPDPEKADDD